jgi:hypothetical protein
MGLFGAIVKTAINVAILPVEVVKDAATMGGDFIDGGKTYTQKHIEKIKDEADED